MNRHALSLLRWNWIAILALLWHALMPLAHAAQGRAGILVTMCGQGVESQLVIPFDGGDPRPALDGSMSGSAFKCPLCSVGAHWAIEGAAAADNALIDPALAHVQRPIPAPLSACSPLRLNFSPRAPPVQA